MPKITDITRQRRNKKRVNLFVDGHFFAGASEYVVALLGLKEGKEVDEATLKKACFEDSVEKAKEYAANYLVGKPEQHIRRKLKEKEYEDEVAERVVETFKKYGYINDADYAKRFAKDAVGVKSKSKGKRRIAMELQQKGIGKEEIESALEGIKEEDEVNAAKTALSGKIEKYRAKTKNPRELRSKLYAYLAGKGFSSDVISKALEEED